MERTTWKTGNRIETFSRHINLSKILALNKLAKAYLPIKRAGALNRREEHVVSKTYNDDDSLHRQWRNLS